MEQTRISGIGTSVQSYNYFLIYIHRSVALFKILPLCFCFCFLGHFLGKSFRFQMRHTLSIQELTLFQIQMDDKLTSCLYFLRLQGSALYKTEDGLTSLYLDGQAGYAEIPAINMRKSNFSISIRLNVQDQYALGHILSDWSSPFQFRMFIYNSLVHVVLRRGGDVQFLLRMSSNR